MASFLGVGATSLTDDELAEIRRHGSFEEVTGRPGIVVAAPHGTADTGSLTIARGARRQTGGSGIFVSGFWGAAEQRRINVNRPTESVVRPDRTVIQTRTLLAVRVNAHYTSLVKAIAQGPVALFVEVHTNNLPRFAESIAAHPRPARPGRDAARRCAQDGDPRPVVSAAARLGLLTDRQAGYHFDHRERSSP